MLSPLQAKANSVPCCWFFPSTFAAEILFQTPMEHLVESYARLWMLPTQELEHVFVPICEPPKTWYMLLLDIKRPSVYALDVCTSMESVPRCERNMRLISDEATLRMKTAIRIVASDYSELKALVDLKVETVLPQRDCALLRIY
ncbi:hypothetical protein Ahy_A04g020172 [Arachis hypogaea]|uniref:Ubiquitin-like protease family profile domain-containing protein n=1 Tax=Arachis hypogaea TaxID=3818 RepID=A0A445DH48_ARAHY|nr:hypothetical protein Ahy_A04g020172 [Arachis hypogaea]